MLLFCVGLAAVERATGVGRNDDFEFVLANAKHKAAGPAGARWWLAIRTWGKRVGASGKILFAAMTLHGWHNPYSFINERNGF